MKALYWAFFTQKNTENDDMYIPECLFLDFETIPSGEYPVVKLRPKPTLADVKVGVRKGEVAANYRETQLPTDIEKWVDECDKLRDKADQEFRHRAVNSMTCEVICMAYAFDNHPPEVIRGTEIEIIQGLNALMNRFGDKKFAINLVGHNIIDFDLKIAFHRAIKFSQISLVRYLSGFTDFQGKQKLHDTMKMWSLLTYGERTKLDDIAKFLGISGKGDIDGSKVYDLFLEGRLDEICDYCKDDIELTRKIYYYIKPEAAQKKTA